MRRLRTALAIVCTALVLASCGYSDDEIGDGGPPEAGENGLPAREEPPDARSLRPPVGKFGYQPPLLPITIEVGTDWSFSISLGSQIITPFGALKYRISEKFGGEEEIRGKDEKPLPAPAPDVTELIICLDGPPPAPCQGYTINSGRKVRVKIDGKVDQQIESDRVLIDVAPGTKIEVFDNGAPAKTGAPGRARIAIDEFKFHERSEHAEVDLERSQAGTQNDLVYDHITGELKTTNGAQVTRFSHHSISGGFAGWGEKLGVEDLPGEDDCKKATDWRDGFKREDFDDDVTLACVRTAEGDLGYVAIGVLPDKKPMAYRVYSYVWVR